MVAMPGYDLAPQVLISGGGGMYVPAPGAEAASTFDAANFVPATGMMVSGGGKMYMPAAPAAVAPPMASTMSTGATVPASTAEIATPAPTASAAEIAPAVAPTAEPKNPPQRSPSRHRR